MSKMSQAEIDHGREAFVKYDADMSGTIDDDELKLVLQDMGYKLSAAETLRVTSQVCERPGAIVLDEFLDLMKLLKSNAATQEDENDLAEAFAYLGGGDDRSGNLDVDKLDYILGEFSLKITATDILHMVDKTSEGGNNNGKIEFDEFKKVLSFS